jgi:predicted dehydrogenase
MLNLGFIGLSSSSWAANAHVPALKTLGEQYSISGVTNSSLESSKASISKHQLTDAQPYETSAQLCRSPSTDVVVVSVKVPLHKQFIDAALNESKAVFSEWPLANGLEEAEEILALARKKGVRTIVGLQSRKAPPLLKAKEILRSGQLGTIISTSIVGISPFLGHVAEASVPRLLLENKNGANLLTIPCGHTLDALVYLLGHFKSLSATLSTRFTEQKILRKGNDTGETAPKDTADQILVQGLLENDVAVSFHVRGGPCTAAVQGFRWEIHGTEGDLVFTGSDALFELVQIKLSYSSKGFDGVKDMTPEYSAVVDNVAGLYKAFSEPQAAELQGSNDAGYPTFVDAVLNHRLLDAIERSSDTGKVVSYDTKA